jgi:NAD+ diphosphatase
VLVPMIAPTGPSSGPVLMVRILGSKVLLSDVEELDDEIAGSALFVGTVAGRHCWAIDREDGSTSLDDETDYVDLMRLFGETDEPTWAAVGRAVQLVEWVRNHRYCGRCGRPTVDSPGEHARRCPACALLAFPRLAPAVITLVERDDGRALLARNARWPTAMYSCLAGFVEPGESVESAVRREVLEEVGVEVDDLRYYRSQPWPFPHSLMLGFHARHRGGEIACDGVEIAEAAWFARDDLPQLPGPISIARWLIDDWVTGVGR